MFGRSVFSKKNYEKYRPILSSIDSHLQSFLGAFSSTIMAINISLFVIFMSNKKDMVKNKNELGEYLSIFISSVLFYFAAILILFLLRAYIIDAIKKNAEDYDKKLSNYERWISLSYIAVTVSCAWIIYLFISLVTLVLKTN